MVKNFFLSVQLFKFFFFIFIIHFLLQRRVNFKIDFRVIIHFHRDRKLTFIIFFIIYVARSANVHFAEFFEQMKRYEKRTRVVYFDKNAGSFVFNSLLGFNTFRIKVQVCFAMAMLNTENFLYFKKLRYTKFYENDLLRMNKLNKIKVIDCMHAILIC